MRMILHRMADDIGHFNKPSVVLVMQGPKNSSLHRFQAVGEIGNGPITNDVAGVFKEAFINSCVQSDSVLTGIEWLRNNVFYRFGDDMLCAVAIAIGFRGFFLGWLGCRLGNRGRAFDGQFCLV